MVDNHGDCAIDMLSLNVKFFGGKEKEIESEECMAEMGNRYCNSGYAGWRDSDSFHGRRGTG